MRFPGPNPRRARAPTPIGGAARLRTFPLLAVVAGMAVACGSSAPNSPEASPTAAATPAPYNPIYGVDLGLHVLSGKDGTAPVPESEVVQLLKVLQGRAQWVRIYDVGPPNQNAPELAHAMGFKVAASAILYGDMAGDEKALSILIDDVNRDFVDYAIVGNEEVHVKSLTAAQEVAYIQEVKQKLHGKVPVGAVEPDRELLANPELMRASDLVLANIPPISYGIPLNKSLDYITTEYAKLVAAAGGAQVGIGETEWPSAGFGSTVADEAKYFADVEAWSRAQSVKTFYFEAFDEPWLGRFNEVGPHWGLWTASLQLKPGMEQVFAQP